jgi:hypothetical protein
MNGLRKCGIYIQRNFIQPQRKIKFCHLQVNRWNWRTSSQAKLARFRRSKVIFSLSYVEYVSNTNTEYYIKKQLMLREDHIQKGEGKRKS